MSNTMSGTFGIDFPRPFRARRYLDDRSQGFALGWNPSALWAEERRGSDTQGFALGWNPSALWAEERCARTRSQGYASPLRVPVATWAGIRQPFGLRMRIAGISEQLADMGKTDESGSLKG